MRVKITYKVTGEKSGALIHGPSSTTMEFPTLQHAENSIFAMCGRRWPGHTYHVHVEPAKAQPHECSVGADEIAFAHSEPAQYHEVY